MEELQPHIRCGKKDAAKYAILPGDPGRVERVGRFLSNVVEVAYNREMKSIRGEYKGVQVMVVSTGMGGASTGITVEELRNIGVTHMIRIGSCGALQSNMQLGDLVIINGAVRDDGASKAYMPESYPAIPDTDILIAMVECAKELKLKHHIGRARSHDSFYTDEEPKIDAYWSSKGILAADMETAALFTIGGIRGIKVGSILNTVALHESSIENEINEYVAMSGAAAQGEQDEILLALETIRCIHMKENEDE